MNLYHCMIELKNDAQALAFASAADQWLSGLCERGLIGGWNLHRRKFGLASGRHSDFVLLIDVRDLAQLESAFRSLAEDGETTDQRHYDLMHDMIATLDVGLYRPFPDANQREAVALV